MQSDLKADLVDEWLAECTDGRCSDHTISMVRAFSRYAQERAVGPLSDAVEAQAAEIARLKREVMLQMGWKTEAQNEIERLREAGKKLNNHGCHDDDCQIVTHGVWSDPIPCTCGYEGAWKSWSAALGETE